MGGIGKTTLAQLAFNHHEVKDQFEKRIWVFFFFFRSGGSPQSWARIRVTGFGGVVGFTVGFGMKNSCGAAGYTRIAGVGLGSS